MSVRADGTSAPPPPDGDALSAPAGPDPSAPADDSLPDRRAARSVGLREVLGVALVVVAVVLGAAALTGLLPTDVQRVVFHAPVLIGVLVIGTALVLWRVALHRPPDA